MVAWLLASCYVCLTFFDLTAPTCTSIKPRNYTVNMTTAVSGRTNLFVGDDLVLTCTLYGDFLLSYTACDIRFNFSIPDNSDKKWVPESNIQSLNSTTAQMTIYNVTVTDAGLYACIVEDRVTEECQTVGYSNDVFIDYSPQNVTDFCCVLFDFTDSMECTWQLGVNYTNMDDIEVTLDFSNSEDDFHTCPNLTPTSCSWNWDSSILREPWMTWTINVNITNRKWNITTSQSFKVYPFHNVKPAPVYNLSCTSNMSQPGCLYFSWAVKSHRNQTFRIKQINENGNFTVLYEDLKDKSFIHCGYSAYTEYNFSVESRPGSPYSGYMSDAVYKSARTAMMAPDQGPEIINGSFFTTQEECSHGYRTVALMWKEVNETARNGIIDHYLIKTENANLSFVLATNFSEFVNISCDYTKLEILSHNEAGFSLSSSVIVIPSSSFTVPEVVANSFSVELLKGKTNFLQAKWATGSRTNMLDYVIFWCQGEKDQACQSELTWQHVPGTQANFSFPPLKVNFEKYEFGISVVDRATGNTSGIVWTDWSSPAATATTVTTESQLQLGAVLGGVAGGLLFLIMSYVVYRSCNAGRKKVQVLKGIQLPDSTNMIETLRMSSLPPILVPLDIQTTMVTSERIQTGQVDETLSNVTTGVGRDEQLPLVSEPPGNKPLKRIYAAEIVPHFSTGKQSSLSNPPDYVQHSCIEHKSDRIDQDKHSQKGTQQIPSSSGHSSDYAQQGYMEHGSEQPSQIGKELTGSSIGHSYVQQSYIEHMSNKIDQDEFSQTNTQLAGSSTDHPPDYVQQNCIQQHKPDRREQDEHIHTDTQLISPSLYHPEYIQQLVPDELGNDSKPGLSANVCSSSNHTESPEETTVCDYVPYPSMCTSSNLTESQQETGVRDYFPHPSVCSSSNLTESPEETEVSDYVPHPSVCISSSLTGSQQENEVHDYVPHTNDAEQKVQHSNAESMESYINLADIQTGNLTNSQHILENPNLYTDSCVSSRPCPQQQM